MTKLITFVTFAFFSICLHAQDNLALTKTKVFLQTEDTIKMLPIDSSVVTKKTFSKNFKNNYKDSVFNYEFKTPEKNAWDHFKEWLAQLFQRLFNFSNNETSQNAASILIKIIAGAIVIFVIYLIVKAIINKEGQWIFGKDSYKKNIHYSEIEKNIHLVDFEKLIHESLQLGQKRVTIRYYYLWLLKIMAQNQHIKWDIEKTNSDYLYELQNQTHKDEFAYLSYIYNYIWYGEFDIDEITFSKAENRFKKALKTFSNV